MSTCLSLWTILMWNGNDGTENRSKSSLQLPGGFEPCVSNKGFVDGHQPSILLLAIYRRAHDNSPCSAYLNCYPDGRMQVKVIEGDPLAKKTLIMNDLWRTVRTVRER